MLIRNIQSCIIVFLLLFSFIVKAYGEGRYENGRTNYIILKNIYDRWNTGLYGSGGLYENRLYRLLVDMTGADIVTGKDYNISLPEVYEKKYYSSDLYNHKWLHIHGPVDESSLKKFKESGLDYIKEAERNKYLYHLSGKIEKFRIIENAYGNSVHLYLESVKISDSIK